MKKNKMKFSKSTIAIAAALILLTGAVIYQFLLINVLIDRANDEESKTLWNTKLIYACYNYEIHPCDDEGTSKWNEQNPDKTITEAYLRDPEL
ncbi:MAG: hypothetical protein WAZ21_03495 [Candidatus Saccharimonadales bacterium]